MFALIRRTQNPHDVHSGQISLPGGSQEGDETPVQTALREAREELGVDLPVQVLGQLTCLYIPPSDFEVRPIVGYIAKHPAWKPDQTEVVEVLECPLVWLFDDAHKVIEDWERDGQIIQVPWYNVNGHKVWGATAIILSEFEHRLRQVFNASKS
jgi:8-oxo-dGTP pyrophosphatase MutT (NUDIX family)